ncbi:MAG: hypothetical protein ACI91Z_001616 [Yoonia sp.]|jgi:hypothetical protein
MVLRLLIVFLFAACSPSDRNIRTYSDATQVWQTVTRDTEVFRDGKDHISARAIILQKDDTVRYYLSFSVLRGGPNGPRLRSMTHNGTVLDYRKHDRLNAFCIDRCHRAEIGAVTFTQAGFRQAANDGMVIEIDGLRRDYTAIIPARLFWNALSTAGLIAPVKTPVNGFP